MTTSMKNLALTLGDSIGQHRDQPYQYQGIWQAAMVACLALVKQGWIKLGGHVRFVLGCT